MLKCLLYCSCLELWLSLSADTLLGSPTAVSPLTLQLSPPAHVLDPKSPNAETFVRHPWPIRNRHAELLAEQSDNPPPPSRNVVTQDGIEFKVSLDPAWFSAGVEFAIYVNLFSVSFTGPEDRVEKWMIDGGLPPPHNPLRLSNMFRHHFSADPLQADEYGDACIGESWQCEICARVSTCFTVSNGDSELRVAAPVRHASSYRLEAYLASPTSGCRKQGIADGGLATPHDFRFPWWLPLIAEHSVPSLAGVAKHAAYLNLKIQHLSKVSFWWSRAADVEPVPSWMQMMRAAIDAAQESVAALPAKFGLYAEQSPLHQLAPHGLWLEFGVGSGKTTAYIAHIMKHFLGDETLLHGFDSFRGLPTSWAHTQLGAGTFSMGGVIPEHLASFSNVKVHVGLFSETLPDLDMFGPAPVAFAHVDVDLYASAVEVLSRIACQLYPGSVVVFDELVNYDGFELSGEFRAWEYVTASYDIPWSYAGMFWQQAVPVLITSRGRAC